MSRTATGRQPVLIEEWLPIRELGIDAGRERRAIGHLPPLFLIHLWWARRPVGVAQGVQLASLMPEWSEDLLDVPGVREALDRTTFVSASTDRERYQNWMMWLAGIRGDNIVGQRRYEAGASAGDAWPWEKAWQVRPTSPDLAALHALLESRWGGLPTVVDPTAGGGTIPFAAIRYGLPAIANDLNPVAVASMMGSVAIPGSLGADARELIENWGGELCSRLERKLEPFFPPHDDGRVPEAYLFANTITCPRTGGPVPLVPNWWLVNKGKHKKVAVPTYHRDGEQFRITWAVKDAKDADLDPTHGTVAGGHAISPWDDLVIDGDEIRRQAQAGGMVPRLYATKVRGDGRGEWEFRPPTSADIDGLNAAADCIRERIDTDWAAAFIPDEQIPEGNDKRPQQFGRLRWSDMFTDRQLLAHATFVETWSELLGEARKDLGDAKADAIFASLAMMQAKALDYNSRSTEWTPGKNGFSHMFARHDFSIKWTFAEYEAGSRLWRRGLNDELLPYLDKLSAITTVDVGSGMLVDSRRTPEVPGALTLMQGPGSSLPHVSDGSVECVNIDPPYYDNVMYAELADFFYVWEKRTLGSLRPDYYMGELTDKDNEAVANPARFAGAGRRRKELARFDYQQKMEAIFAEAFRILKDDGVLVVWFTHKRADAWDTLGTAMIDAGFTIETSWPVNTEAQVSLHQTNVNAAASTIILVCRKRRSDSEGVFFEEIESDVRRAALDAVSEFSDSVGVTGVDLQLSTYGPTLSVISSHWPVLSDEAGEDGRARRLRPEEALEVAREEVNRLVKSRLVGHAAEFDDATDFWLLCWANFQAREFPYDEARKLGMSTLDVDDAVQAGLVKKKAGKVELVKPASRGRSLRSKMADTGRFPTLVDALHHLLNSYRDDGLASTRTWLADSGYGDERAFLDTLQASVNAIPRVRTKKGLSVPEAQELEDVVIALFGDKIEIPAEVEELIEAQQTSLEV